MLFRLLTVIGLIAAAVLIAASATMNYVFVSSLGKTPFEGTVLGSVSVAVDVMKALLAVFVTKALRDGHQSFAVIGGCAFLLFSLGSFLAATGFTSVNRGAVTDERKTAASVLSELEQDLADARQRRVGLGQHRASPVLLELMASQRIDARWRASAECAAPTLSSHRELCGQMAALKVELATAEEAARLEAVITGLRGRINSLRRSGSGAAIDPQARFLAESLGLSETAVQRLLMSMLALIVEVSSALGIYLATAHDRRTVVPMVTAEAGASRRSTANGSPEKGAAAAATVSVPSSAGEDVDSVPTVRRRARASIGIAAQRNAVAKGPIERQS